MSENNKLSNLVRFMLAITLISDCSNISSVNKPKRTVLDPSNNIDNINNMIAKLKPNLDNNARAKLALEISYAAKKFRIDSRLIVAIIDTESNFDSNKISSSGDVSMAQINVEVWNKELARIKKPLLNKNKILKNKSYAILKMTQILSILKKRYEKKDVKWYARYHAKNHKYKDDYVKKIEKRLNLIASSPLLFKNKLAEIR